jgi:hypothetical protein
MATQSIFNFMTTSSTHTPYLFTSGPDTYTKNQALNLFSGPQVTITIGNACHPNTNPPTISTHNPRKTFTLPKALLSHFSPFFHRSQQRNPSVTHMELPDEHPVAFAMYVEFMKYGTYNTSVETIHYETTDGINMCIHAWILGNKLMARGFQNHAMQRVYEYYLQTSLKGGEPQVSPVVVSSVCGRCLPEFALWRFFRDMLGEYWAHEEGSIVVARVDAADEEDWEMVFQQNPELREGVFELGAKCVGVVEEYLDGEEMIGCVCVERRKLVSRVIYRMQKSSLFLAGIKPLFSPPLYIHPLIGKSTE